jgi:hypothetical protein
MYCGILSYHSDKLFSSVDGKSFVLHFAPRLNLEPRADMALVQVAVALDDHPLAHHTVLNGAAAQ